MLLACKTESTAGNIVERVRAASALRPYRFNGNAFLALKAAAAAPDLLTALTVLLQTAPTVKCEATALVAMSQDVDLAKAEEMLPRVFNISLAVTNCPLARL